jgi:hypothetical protein
MNWWHALKKAMEADGEAFPPLYCTLPEAEMRRCFDGGFGSTEGAPFTAWGERWVYFPICYDGAEWVGHAPRNPCDTAMEHQGGG